MFGADRKLKRVSTENTELTKKSGIPSVLSVDLFLFNLRGFYFQLGRRRARREAGNHFIANDKGDKHP
uniref:Uncharacterized protein n=1 Tax=Candidatus Kentrum sp. DK TaxID=2126562 RepID=A0A450SSQ2_9GAMM|nr:MAG: hypothetical protein BECKDK2373C_GA0170839_105613 [Candidatus Kentron sp. DK]